MTAFGVPPRTVAIVAAVLAVIGAAAVIAGAFSSREWIMVALLVVVAAINWRRARQAAKPPSDQPKQ
jgi:membrane protein implicated in regulation of membrane protease activity